AGWGPRGGRRGWHRRRGIARSAPGDAQHVVHGIEAGAPPREPAHRAQGAAGERVATVRAVRELEALAERAERHGVLADHVTRAQRHDADFLAAALPGEPFAPV